VRSANGFKLRGSELDTRQGIQSVELGATLLETFAAASGPITLRALASSAGMSSSKAHRYLISLLRCGLVHQDPVSGRYDLGDMSLRLGLAALGRVDAVRFANEAIIELNQRLDVMMILTVWGDRGPTVISLYNRSELLLANLNIGSVIPLLRSASGRVFVAFLPHNVIAASVEQALKHASESSPPTNITTHADVEKLISQVRKQRYGMTRGDLVPGRRAIAAPVFDHQGLVVAVGAMIGVPEPSEGHIAELLSTMNGVSRRLGFSTEASPFVERMSHQGHSHTQPGRLLDIDGVAGNKRKKSGAGSSDQNYSRPRG
jgi:DNA-binding IclR family transcriptional regulator